MSNMHLWRLVDLLACNHAKVKAAAKRVAAAEQEAVAEQEQEMLEQQ